MTTWPFPPPGGQVPWTRKQCDYPPTSFCKEFNMKNPIRIDLDGPYSKFSPFNRFLILLMIVLIILLSILLFIK